MRIRYGIVAFALLAASCTQTTAGHPTAAGPAPTNSPSSSLPTTTAPPSSGTPSGTTPVLATGQHGGIVVGPGGKVNIELFEDADCPFCAQFEATNSSALRTLIASGRASVEYHMLSVLDQNSVPPGYSSRAAAAVGCMPDLTSFAAFHTALFAHQPKEFGPGLSDAQLDQFAQLAGASSAVGCINSQQYAGWVSAATNAAKDRGVTQIPYVFVNDKPVTMKDGSAPDQATILAAVHAAGG